MLAAAEMNCFMSSVESFSCLWIDFSARAASWVAEAASRSTEQYRADLPLCFVTLPLHLSPF